MARFAEIKGKALTKFFVIHQKYYIERFNRKALSFQKLLSPFKKAGRLFQIEIHSKLCSPKFHFIFLKNAKVKIKVIIKVIYGKKWKR